MKNRNIGGGLCAFVITVGSLGGVANGATVLEISGGESFSDSDTNAWRFQALSDLRVSSLGSWDENSDGLPSPVDVGLWDDVGNLLASVVVPSGTAATLDNGFRFSLLGADVELSAGNFYRVGSSVQSGQIEYRANSDIVVDSAIDFDRGYFARSSNVLTFPVNETLTPDVADFFGANFQYQPIPEPSSALILGLGAVVLLPRRVRR